MPLYTKTDSPDFSIGTWKIEEGLPFFETLFNGHPNIQHANKRLQWFASRHLANEMLGQHDVIINNESGKPAFKTAPTNISISHTAGFAAVILSKQYAVGIDVEAIHPKIERIAHKFLQPHEVAAIQNEEKIAKLVLYWSAKEALYKLYGWGGIEFATQLLIEPFSLKQAGVLNAHIVTPALSIQNLTVHYDFFEGHVLSYVVGS